VITSKSSAKVRHILNGDDRVAICQIDGPRWSTIEGIAVVRTDADAVAEAVRRYALRYRQPRTEPAARRHRSDDHPGAGIVTVT